MNYNVHNEPINQTNEFLDSLPSNSFLSYTLKPTRITCQSKILIDNIFTKVILPPSVSRNLRATISDHLPHFLIVPKIFFNIPSNKFNIYGSNWSKFDRENFILDYFSIDWSKTLKIEEQNIVYSTEIFLNKISELLDNVEPVKKTNKYQLKLKSKP